MAGNTALQAWREVPFTEFSPYETRAKLPDGAYLGQIVATKGPDQPMFRVVQNSSTAITWDGDADNKEFIPKPVEMSYKEDSETNNVRAHVPSGQRSNYRVNSGRIRVPLSLERPAAVDVDEFQGGYMVVIDGPGTGQIYNIQGNGKPYAKGGETVSNIFLEEELRISFTQDTEVRLVANQYKDVGQATNKANLCCGFALVPVPANHFFLAQIRGACLVKIHHTSGLNLSGGGASGDQNVLIYKVGDPTVNASTNTGRVGVREDISGGEADNFVFKQTLGYLLEPRNIANQNDPVLAMLDIV